MRRIAIVSPGLSNGGAERVAALLANNLCYEGNKVLFIAVYSDEKKYNLDKRVDYLAIKKHDNRLARFLFRTRDVDRAIEQFKSDIVISFVINEILLTSIKKRIPVICSLRIDPAYITASKINTILCDYIFAKAKKIVFQTPGARDCYSRKIKKKGVIIGNFLTPDLPYWDETNNSQMIITACRLHEQKNLPMLIKGFYLFQKSFPEYSLWIYGEGELKNTLIDYSSELGISDKVFFPGYADNIYEIMKKASMFTLTSDYEGLSNSMLEALAIGVPTICTDCRPGGAKLYIKDGINGFLIPIGDYKFLAKRMKEVAENKHLAIKMSYNSRNIRNELSEKKILDKWKKIL